MGRHPLQLRSRSRAATMAIGIALSLAALTPAARASSTITVTTIAPAINADGACSLQEAIYSANLEANLAPDPADPAGVGFVTTGCAAGIGASRGDCESAARLR